PTDAFGNARARSAPRHNAIPPAPSMRPASGGVGYPSESEAPTSLRCRGFFMPRIAGGLGGTRHCSICRDRIAPYKPVGTASGNQSCRRQFIHGAESFDENCSAPLRDLARFFRFSGDGAAGLAQGKGAHAEDREMLRYLLPILALCAPALARD